MTGGPQYQTWLIFIVEGHFHQRSINSFIFLVYFYLPVAQVCISLPRGKVDLHQGSMCINHMNLFTVTLSPACVMFMLHRIPACSILMNMHGSFYIWSLLTLLAAYTVLGNSPLLLSISRTSHCYHAFIFRLLLHASIYLCKFMYLHKFPSHSVYTRLPSWLSNTLFPPVVCTVRTEARALLPSASCCVFTAHQSMKACTRSSHASFTATSPLCVVHRSERPAVSGADEC